MIDHLQVFAISVGLKKTPETLVYIDFRGGLWIQAYNKKTVYLFSLKHTGLLPLQQKNITTSRLLFKMIDRNIGRA